MTEKKEVYRCNVCGNIVNLLCTGPGELICCKAPMELLEAEQRDVGPEKHIPVIEKSENGVKVKVGEVPHPMEEEHHIMWVELSTPDQLYIQLLGADDLPEAKFPVNLADEKEITAKCYCNIHGFWKS